MAIATQNDVRRLIPDIEDHAIVEILGARATVAEIEAALAELASDDDQLIELERRHGDRIHTLLRILRQSQIEPETER